MSKNDFLRTLQAELKPALDELTKATIAPVDMAQAAIGPGIAVYSRYDRIADMTDTPLTVRDALKIINDELEKYLGEQNLDAASQFCAALFTQCFFNEMTFGEADVLARAKGVAVDGLTRIGAVISGKGDVRLRDRDEMPVFDENKQLNREWLKTLVDEKCAWLWVQSLVLVMGKIGVNGCGELLSNYDGELEPLKNLAYRLYNVCDKKKFAKEAAGYNDLVTEWQDILSARADYRQKKSEPPKPVQGTIYD